MADADASSPSIAANLETLLRTRKERVSVGDIVHKVELSGGLAPVVFLLTLPLLLPLPPGVSIVLAVPLLLVAPQMMVGRRSLWLPERLARQSVTRERLHKGVERFLPWVRRVECWVRPRLSPITGRAGSMVAGLLCTAMAVVLVLPIPFANLLPAVTVCLICLAITRRDGVLMILSLAGVGLTVAAIAWGAHGVRLAWHAVKAVV